MFVKCQLSTNKKETCISPLFLKILCIYLERGREGERDGQKHQCVVASPVYPTGHLARNPGMCPDWEWNRHPFGSQPTLNPLSYTSQGVSLHFTFYPILEIFYFLLPPESATNGVYITFLMSSPLLPM